MKKLIHLSDLHVGMNKAINKSIIKLVENIEEVQPDKIIITGDLCDHGSKKEYDLYCEAFRKFIDDGKVILTAGNHDRTGQDVGASFMKERIEVFENNNLYIINIDSTGEHNKKAINAHGIIERKTLNDIDTLIANAPKDKVVCLMLHHHLYSLPEEAFWEYVSRYLGFRFTLEIRTGNELIEMCKGRVDCVFSGHRHNPYCLEYPGSRPLYIYNAGSSTIGRKYRVLKYKDGHLVGDPVWVHF